MLPSLRSDFLCTQTQQIGILLSPDSKHYYTKSLRLETSFYITEIVNPLPPEALKFQLTQFWVRFQKLGADSTIEISQEVLAPDLESLDVVASNVL